MNLRDVLAAREAAARALQAGLDALKAERSALLSGIESDGRTVATAEEDQRFSELTRQIAEKTEAITAAQPELDQLRAEVKADDEATRSAQETHEVPNSGAGSRRAYDEVARVGREERTYTKQKDARGEARFFVDAYRAQKGDWTAQERLNRHGQEVVREREISERSLTTGGIAGLTVPQYLVDMAAPILRAGRPLANIVNRHELPDSGMTLFVPRGTTGASAAEQATEGTGVSNTDEVWANLQVPVVTVSGQQDVSRQALERGEAVDSIVYMDLARAHAAKLDNLLINGSGAAGQPLGILNTGSIGASTAYGAAATAATFSLKVAGGIAGVTSAGAGIFPKVLVMHPRRWGWLTGLVDGSNRPIVIANATGPFNASAVISQAGGYSGDTQDAGLHGAEFIGVHSSGLPVLTDLNIPTNVGTPSEDVVLALDTVEQHLWEDGDGMPRQLEFEQTTGGSLLTKLVVYSYAAFTAGRYPAAAYKIGGADTVAGQGQVAPTF